MTKQDAIRLTVPKQDLDKSSIFDCDESAVAAWVTALPMANLGQTTRQLYEALTELNRVRMLPHKRMAILEQLRSPIYFVSRALTKHYLNQPIILPSQARKVSTLAHTLHLQLATGYTIVATHTSALGKKSGVSKPGQLIAQALQRALTDYTLNIIRHYQLYEPIDEKCWYNLHQFYALARQHNITQAQVADKEYGDLSVEEAYIRVMLLGCARPNQLRQEDFMQVFSPLNQWAALCSIHGANENGLFVIDPSSDSPPIYRSLCESVVNERCLSLNTQRLNQHILQLKEQGAKGGLRVKDGEHMISLDLVNHLVLAWAEMSKRTFMRIESNEELNICIGLSTTHHFVSGEINFEALVQERGARTYTMMQDNPFLKQDTPQHRQKDVWDSPYENNLGQTNVALESIDFHMQKNETENKESSKYHDHPVKMINSSAHGYCIEWPSNKPAAIKTGEIIGVKEAHSHNWSIAVIRWVKRARDGQTQIGLELLSPSASPYGARVIHKTGSQGDYVRVLVLPEIPMIKMPITLLTPRVPFQVGQKAVINQRGKEVEVQLTKKLNKTGAYNQFEFRKITTAHQLREDPENKDDFDSLWNSL